MTLGQRIAARRKALGLSQEALGARLGVSRQAVSKWETDAATPDMENLMALARMFNVSLPELTDTPGTEEPASPLAEEPSAEAPAATPPSARQGRWAGLAAGLAVVLLAGAAFLIWYRHDQFTSTASTVPEPAPPETEFYLYWNRRVPDGSNNDSKPTPYVREYLTLGEQDHPFPFGTTLELTEPEEVTDTDFSSMTRHRADCGEVAIVYHHIEDEDGARDIVVSLSTISTRIATPRGIIPREIRDDLLSMYGDELVYHFKEEDGYTLVPHDYYYVYSAYEDGIGWAAIRFYMKDGLVAGISMEALGELGDYYAPDGISCFPLKDGEPDFSQRREPEQEYIDDTRRAYIAWNQLVTNNNLSAEERYAYRRDAFCLLPYLDWGEFMTLGGTEYPDDTAFAFIDWLARQDSYSQGEMLSLQMGCTAKGLDGAYTDSYCAILSRALFYDPVSFAKALATDGVDEDVKWQAIRFTAYDAELYPVELDAAVNALDSAIDGGVFTEEQRGWAKLLRLYLLTPIDERVSLPTTPDVFS